MASLPLSMPSKVGSTRSAASGIRDVIASYRRAQYLVVGSTCVSTRADDEIIHSDEDEEAWVERFDGRDQEAHCTPTSEGSPQDEFVSQLEWDEDFMASNSLDPAAAAVAAVSPGSEQSPPGLPHSLPVTKQLRAPSQTKRPHKPALKQLPGTSASLGAQWGTPLSESQRLGMPASLGVRWKDTPFPKFGETTPLLAKVSFDAAQKQMEEHGEHHYSSGPSHVVRRRLSSGSISRSVKSTSIRRGQSTFGQTLFNSIAILLGVGMLSEPLAFAYSGWFMGTILIVMYGAFSCYTAKILARIICSDPRLRTYSDIGRKAFGPRATVFVNFMFCLELFTVGVILVTLYADSLHTLIPTYSADVFKIWGLPLLIPTVFLPLSLLSYTSVLGLISIVFLIAVVFMDGAFKMHAPGSFWDPAETTFGVASTGKLGLAFGLFMAGFAGHSVIPSLAKDMIDPSKFDKMINWAFVVASVIYMLIGYAGYLMFGSNVSDEISIDILNTPGFNPLLNQAVLWMLVLNPLSKFALNTRPLMSTLEILTGLDPLDEKGIEASTGCGLNRALLRKIIATGQRVILTFAVVAVSIYIPEFSVMMAFLGSFSAFSLSIVGPIAAKVKLEGTCGLFDAAVMFIGSAMAIWGTIAAFLSL